MPEQLAQQHDLDVEVVLLDDETGPDDSHQFVLGNDAVVALDERQQQVQGAAAEAHGLTGSEQRSPRGKQSIVAERIDELEWHGRLCIAACDGRIVAITLAATAQRRATFKPTLAATVPALALFLLFQACGGSGDATAQEAADPAEGVWESNVTVKDCTSGAVLATFRGAQVIHRGGTLSDTNSAPTTARGPGFGVWSRSGTTYTTKFRFFTYDSTGAVSGVTRVTRTFTISADGRSQTSSNSNQTEDLNGVVIRSACGSDVATRVL